jgi:hypothetical protein
MQSATPEGSAAQIARTSVRNCVAHAWLTSPVHKMLELEAAGRGKHPDRLAAEILNSVLLNGYVDAVLQELPH